jgi:hypothetical protein
MPRRKVEREAELQEVTPTVKQEEVDVELMFDRLWEAFLDVTEDEVYYDARTPERLREEMSQELGDAIAGALMYDAEGDELCDTLATTYFADYIVSGRSPSVRKLKADVEEDLANCMMEEGLDELVKCVNAYYRCYKLLVKFLRSLPNLLSVEIVAGDL